MKLGRVWRAAAELITGRPDGDEGRAGMVERGLESVPTLVERADSASDPHEKVALYLEAASRYASEFANESEAARTYERVLAIEPAHPVAVAFLLRVHEKRRDWEKLVAVGTAAANAAPAGPDRAAELKPIARLAMERVRNPHACIELWSTVLENDPEDIDALSALSELYERGRDFEQVADVLERYARITVDAEEKVRILTKLGQIAGGALEDPARAAEAYQALLKLRPDDSRADAQLRKHLAKLGR